MPLIRDETPAVALTEPPASRRPRPTEELERLAMLRTKLEEFPIRGPEGEFDLQGPRMTRRDTPWNHADRLA